MILGILQARCGSTRLPGKVLKPILGRPMLAHQIERLRRAVALDELIVVLLLDVPLRQVVVVTVDRLVLVLEELVVLVVVEGDHELEPVQRTGDACRVWRRGDGISRGARRQIPHILAA